MISLIDYLHTFVYCAKYKIKKKISVVFECYKITVGQKRKAAACRSGNGWSSMNNSTKVQNILYQRDCEKPNGLE